MKPSMGCRCNHTKKPLKCCRFVSKICIKLNWVIQNKDEKLQLKKKKRKSNVQYNHKELRLLISGENKFFTSNVHSSSFSPSRSIFVSLYTFPISSCNGDTLNSILCKLKPIPTPMAFKKLSFKA